MNYLKKNFYEIFHTVPPTNYEYDKPANCPHCGIHHDADHKTQYQYKDDFGNEIFFLVLQCTACKKLFTATYHIQDGKSVLDGISPKTISTYHDTLIDVMSPRFIEIYNQSLRAVANEDFNLAAIGYRTALEILIKDYAINELNNPPEEVVNKKLFTAISEYLPDTSSFNTADVVRILGNDFTHYTRKYPEYDFRILQSYMDIFISVIRNKLMIAHPPVSRE